MFKTTILLAFTTLIASMTVAQVPFTTTPNAIIKQSGGALITLNNIDLIFNSNFEQSSGDGIFRFTGNGNSQIAGTGNLLIDVLDISKSGSGKVLLNRNLRIGSEVNLNSGNLELANGIMVLEGNSVLNGENEDSRVTGTGGFVEKTMVLNAPTNVNPGNLGAIITSTSNLGSTTIHRGHTSQVNGAGAGNSILRFYDITPVNNTSTITLKFQYMDAELNGLNEADLVQWRRTSPPTWIMEGFDARNTGVDIVTKSGITQFGRFTLSDVNNPLPLHFLSFNVECDNGSVVAKVVTTQEANVDHLELQGSVDGQPWVTKQRLLANNTPGDHTYRFTDASPVSGEVYQVASLDIDGRQSYTNSIRSTCSSINTWKAWPNPVHDRLNISVPPNVNGQVAISVYDAQGRLTIRQEARVTSTSNIISIDVSRLAKGIYQVVLVSANGLQTAIQVIK